MATVGQIVYNIQDYQNSGGYISTSNSNLNATISSADNPNYNEAKINIFDTNVVSRYGRGEFTKLGVQAPPGTRFILNTNKTILVGRSGIYELDEDILITSLQFIRPKKYIKDEKATEEALNNGISKLQEAEDNRTTSLTNLNNDESLTEEEYWKEYYRIQDDYNAQHQTGLKYLNMGINGIYKLDPNVEEDSNDLYNIIIDFLY